MILTPCASRPRLTSLIRSHVWRWSSLRAAILGLLFLIAPRLAPAQGNVLWMFQGIEDINAMVEVPDVDLDGVPEVAVETYDSGAGIADHLYLLSGGSSGTPAVIWSIRPFGGLSSGGGDGDDCLNAAPDLSGDGFPDLVLGTAWGGRSAYGIDAIDGGVLWTFDTYVNTPPNPPESGWVYTIHPIADLDGDLVSDVIFGCGSDNNGAYAVNGASGSVIYRLSALDAIFASGALGDVDGDGLSEAVFGAGDNDDRVYCVRGSSVGSANLLWVASPGATNWHLTPFVDVDGDGKNDVVTATWNLTTDQVQCLSGATGTQIWAYSTGSYNYGMRVVPLDDVNGDGVPDIAVGSWDNAAHVVSGADGSGIWRAEVGTLNGGDVWAIDRVDDVTGDGISDVVAGSFDNNVYLFDGVSGAEVWSTNVGARLYSVRGVSDLSGNGIPDVLAGTQQLPSGGPPGRLFALEGNVATGVEIPAVVSARPLAGGIEISWETSRFLPGTTFNVYRRELETEGSGKAGHLAAKAALAQADLPARQVKELVLELSSDDPFEQLNEEPITSSDGTFARFLDRTTRPGARYEYRVGWSEPGRPGERYLDPASATAPGAPGVRLTLGVPAPQPARGEVTLELGVPTGETAEVAIFGIEGRLVRQLDRELAGGVHRVLWDGRDDEGRPLPAGIYVVSAAGTSGQVTQKVILVP